MRGRVYDITRGHALCVSIIGTLWQEQDDHPLTLADLPKLQQDFNERALIEYVRKRLDKRLKAPFRELTRYSVLLRSFNLPMLQDVFAELLPADTALDLWRKFIDYPYIEKLGNQRYAVHDLLRELQAAEIREQQPTQWQSYHQRALDYLTKLDAHSPDWYYHAIAVDEDEGMSAWWDAMVEPKNYAASNLTALCDAAFDVILKFLPANEANRAFHLGRVQQLRDQYDDALASYADALRLFQQVDDRLGEANVRKAIGDVHQFRKQLDDALASYADALRLFQQVGSRLGEANVRKAIGDVHQFRKQLDDALASYADALRLFQQVGDRLGEANCFLAQGRVALQQDGYRNSLGLHNKAFQLYRDIGDRYSQARLLYYRSFVYEATGERERAIADAEQAGAIARSLNLPYFQDRLGELKSGQP